MVSKFQNFITREKDCSNPDTIKTWWAGVIFLFGAALFFLGYWNFVTLPKELTVSDIPNNPNDFIGTRALMDLVDLTKDGPRVVGSINNEVKAVNFIKSTVEEIIKQKHSAHNIEIDHQIIAGDLSLWNYVFAYRGIQNIVAKLTPAGEPEPEHYLMLSSHFDSVVGSPGAADDGYAVVVLFEVLRVLSQSADKLKHGIIFLWNGSEELGLEGAHGFIKHHKWANNVRAFINMDGTGLEFRDLVLQVGPKHSWLMKYYRKVAPHPHASTLVEEIFQAGIFPSDTDYRVYRDYGGIPGFDFVHLYDSYRYHTKFDNVEGIDVGALQHSGDNVLALTRALANADELSNTEDHEGEEQPIFYDFMDWFVIQYSKTAGVVMNTVIGGLTIIIIIASVLITSFSKRDKNTETSPKFILHELFYILIAQSVTIGISIGVIYILGLLYDGIGRSLSWYTSKWLLFGLYYCPFWFCLAIGPLIYDKYGRSILKIDEKHCITLRTITKLFLDAHALILSVTLIVLTAIGLRSSYVLEISIFFYMIFSILNIVLERGSSHKQKCHHGWIILHFICQIIPFLINSVITVSIFKLVVAYQSRMTGNPEFKICLIVLTTAILLSGFIMPYVLLLRNRWLFVFIFPVFMIIFLILMATSIGFPYNDTRAPVWIVSSHTQSKLYNSPNVTSGYTLQPTDRHGMTYIKEWIGENYETPTDSSPSNYVDFEFSDTQSATFENGIAFYPAKAPTFERETTLLLVEKTNPNPNVKRFKFHLKGTDFMIVSMYLSNKFEMHAWSFGETNILGQQYGEDKVIYNMRLVFGNFETDTPYEFWIEVEGDISTEKDIEIKVTSHHSNYATAWSNEFRQFLDKLPGFVFPQTYITYSETFYFI